MYVCAMSKTAATMTKRAARRPLGMLMSWLHCGPGHDSSAKHMEVKTFARAVRLAGREAFRSLPGGEQMLARECVSPEKWMIPLSVREEKPAMHSREDKGQGKRAMRLGPEGQGKRAAEARGGRCREIEDSRERGPPNLSFGC